MKLANTIRDKERKTCEKYKKENSKLKKDLRELKGVLVEVSNLVQNISLIRSFTQNQKNPIDRKVRPKNRKLPSKRLNHRRHRTHRLSSSLIKLVPSNNSFKPFVSTDNSSIMNSTMNSSFVISNLSTEKEVCIDQNPICGWVSPADSEGGSSVYFTAKSSVRSNDEPLIFYDANDGYDADVEMSEVLMHEDAAIDLSKIHNTSQNALPLPQSQSLSESMDFSIHSPLYVTQQSSDVFSDFGEILNSEPNNNDVAHDSHHLKVQQQSALINSPIFPSGSNASVNLSGVQNDDIGHKSPAHQQRQATPSVQQQQQQHTDELVTQNTEQCQNESDLSIDERSQFEYQSNESQSRDNDRLVPAAATNADVIENALFLFPKYPHTFGSFLNTSSVFNYRSPNANESQNTNTSTIETHHQSLPIGSGESLFSQYDDSIGNALLELAKDLSSSSSMFENSTASEPMPYEYIFNTPYMQQTVEYFAQEYACEFSIDEYLSPELLEYERVKKVCTCCCCKLREKNGCTLDACIRKHPREVHCQQLQTKGAICNACIDSMVLISKRTKTKLYRCIDNSCEDVFKTVPSLRNHYLEHLKCKMYFCNFCSNSYNTIRGLRTHERSHAKK